jgi:hypothetical protein
VFTSFIAKTIDDMNVFFDTGMTCITWVMAPGVLLGDGVTSKAKKTDHKHTKHKQARHNNHHSHNSDNSITTH